MILINNLYIYQIKIIFNFYLQEIMHIIKSYNKNKIKI